MKIFVYVLPLIASCAAAPQNDPCARAAARLDACGISGFSPATCDPDAAAAIAGLSCEALLGAAKSDGVSRALSALACAAGIVRFCPPLACSAPSYPAPSAVCADYIGIAGCGGCQYYACREASGHCGPGGYYLGFAEKYCDRFLLTLRPRMSPAGQKFLDAGRDCLMQYAEDHLAPGEDCAEVKRRAFASHVACYHDHGFCNLSYDDRWMLLNAVDPADVDWLTALRTGLSCVN